MNYTFYLSIYIVLLKYLTWKYYIHIEASFFIQNIQPWMKQYLLYINNISFIYININDDDISEEFLDIEGEAHHLS